MAETAKTPPRELSIKVEDNSYVIKYPNTGQFLQIESMKISLTQDKYNSMVTGSTVSSQMARYTTDMIAFLSVCCPQMKKDLKVDTFSELDAIANKKILSIYIKTILPWLFEWEELLNAEDEEVKKEETV